MHKHLEAIEKHLEKLKAHAHKMAPKKEHKPAHKAEGHHKKSAKAK